MEEKWAMHFADTGLAALDECSRYSFDVVVSDMQMPGMDGTELLSEIRRLYPGTIRLMLSDHTDNQAILQALGATHQFLSKPCDPETLQTAVERASALKHLLANPRLTKLVSGMDNIPTMPDVYRKIVAVLQKHDASLLDVGAEIANDIGMTTNILKLVNSAFFGLAQPVSSIERAVSLLGMSTANIARSIATHEKLDATAVDDAFLVGVIHDIGKLLLATEMPEEYGEVISRVGDQNAFSDAVERELMGATHAEVGAYLVALWGFPDTIVEAVAYHEDPGICLNYDFGLLAITHAAVRLAIHPDADPADPALNIDTEYLEAVNALDKWPDWRGLAQSDDGAC
jgi:HD-like signal output (HDOD) protein